MEVISLFTTVIKPSDVNDHLGDPNWAIFDCRFDLNDPDRGRKEYEHVHVPGAVYLNLEKQLSDNPDGSNGRHPLPSLEKQIDLVSSMGIQRQTQVVVYDDDGGGYAARLWWMLRFLGHQDVAVMSGGIQAWMAAGYAQSSGSEKRLSHPYPAKAQSDRLLTGDQLENLDAYKDVLILDSRAPERYRGEEEPLDPVAGHIPGARNRFWRLNLDTEGHFKSADEIRMELEPLVRKYKVEDAVIYCGSGVTACHNILAFMHAGYPMPRLYAGSWSEWCSDPNRAVETGQGK